MSRSYRTRPKDHKGKKKPPLDVGQNEFQADAQVVKLQKHVFGVRID